MTALPGWLAPLPDAGAMRAADAAAIEAGTPGPDLMDRAGHALAALAGRPHLIRVDRGPLRQGQQRRGRVRGGADPAGGRSRRHGHRDVLHPRSTPGTPPTRWNGSARRRVGSHPSCSPAPRVSSTVCWARARPALPTAWSPTRSGLCVDSSVPVVACDVPSGVDASTGEVADDELVVHAAATVTFAAAKPGLWISPGKACAGTVSVADIGLPADLDAGTGLLAGDAVLGPTADARRRRHEVQWRPRRRRGWLTRTDRCRLPGGGRRRARGRRIRDRVCSAVAGGDLRGQADGSHVGRPPGRRRCPARTRRRRRHRAGRASWWDAGRGRRARAR